MAASAQMQVIQQLLAEQALQSKKAGVGSPLAVPLLVLPPFMQPPTPKPQADLAPHRHSDTQGRPGRQGAVLEGPQQAGAYGSGREVLLQVRRQSGGEVGTQGKGSAGACLLPEGRGPR